MKRRHTWDDDLLGTALVLTLMAFLLSLSALATQSTADERRARTGRTVPLILLASVSAVVLAILGSVVS